MKKLMTLMLGLAFLTSTVAVTFAQDTKSDSTPRKKSEKKSGTTKSDTHQERFAKPFSNIAGMPRSAVEGLRGFPDPSSPSPLAINCNKTYPIPQFACNPSSFQWFPRSSILFEL